MDITHKVGARFIDNNYVSWKITNNPFEHRIDSGELKKIAQAVSQNNEELYFDEQGIGYELESIYANAKPTLTQLIAVDNCAVLFEKGYVYYDSDFVKQNSFESATAETFEVLDKQNNTLTIKNDKSVEIQKDSAIFIKNGASIVFNPSYHFVVVVDGLYRTIETEGIKNTIKVGDFITFTEPTPNKINILVADKIASFSLCEADLSVTFSGVEIMLIDQAKFFQVAKVLLGGLTDFFE